MCAEFGIRAEKCQERGEEPASRVQHDETWVCFTVTSRVVVVVVAGVVYLINNGQRPTL